VTGGGGADEALADRLAARTAELCAVLTPIGGEGPLCDRVEAWARGRFLHAHRVKDSLVVLVDGARPGAAQASPGAGPAGAGGGAPQARPLVALCGHLDTVPVHEDDLGPPRREGDRLVAPGSSDMKGGLALMMALAEALPGPERFCDLALVFYAREEGPYLENELEDVLASAPELKDVSLAVNMGLNLAIVLPLAFIYPDKPGLHALLALNNGIGAWFNATMLYRGLRKQNVLQHSTGWGRTLWQVLAGNVAMGLFLWFVAGDTQRWLDMNAWHRIGWMGVLVAGGAGIYFGTLYVLGMRLKDLRHQKIDLSRGQPGAAA
jgi:hypothetical protein